MQVTTFNEPIRLLNKKLKYYEDIIDVYNSKILICNKITKKIKIHKLSDKFQNLKKIFGKNTYGSYILASNNDIWICINNNDPHILFNYHSDNNFNILNIVRLPDKDKDLLLLILFTDKMVILKYNIDKKYIYISKNMSSLNIRSQGIGLHSNGYMWYINCDNKLYLNEYSFYESGFKISEWLEIPYLICDKLYITDKFLFLDYQGHLKFIPNVYICIDDPDNFDLTDIENDKIYDIGKFDNYVIDGNIVYNDTKILYCYFGYSDDHVIEYFYIDIKSKNFKIIKILRPTRFDTYILYIDYDENIKFKIFMIRENEYYDNGGSIMSSGWLKCGNSLKKWLLSKYLSENEIKLIIEKKKIIKPNIIINI